MFKSAQNYTLPPEMTGIGFIPVESVREYVIGVRQQSSLFENSSNSKHGFVTPGVLVTSYEKPKVSVL